ncbi:MotE family protein [Pallidibacillus pasinlerensis]|uniref:Magnesium transporter MgtE intracellular domain-containing protein n=1 Tax=Pallidibacillus pasinlerensis TaxID=2703818 RepID=A0ABX0A7N3_9BACI|nr:hypothetical protein [Pallidibacillus pasinlerensis]NCU18240.1 hypothetical protein [Pallidibacillus pasinlerensis]
MKKDVENETKKRSNIGKKILFAFVLPIVVILLVITITFSILGKNIFQEASSIPVIGTLFSSDKSALTTEDLQRQINQLKATLSDEQAKISDLELLLEQKEAELKALKEEKDQLENDLNNEATTDSSDETTEEEWISVVKTYENMKPKNAAAILTSMDESTALSILSSMREKNVAAILEKMPAEDAAKFTAKLMQLQQ